MKRNVKHENEFYIKFNSSYLGFIILLAMIYVFFKNNFTSNLLIFFVGIYFIILGYIGGFYLKRFPKISARSLIDVDKPASYAVGVLLIGCGLFIISVSIYNFLSLLTL